MYLCVIFQDMCIGGHTKSLLTLDEFKQVLSPYVIDRKEYMSQCSLSEAFWGESSTNNLQTISSIISNQNF